MLRQGLTNKSKIWVARALANVWAKISQQGVKYIYEFTDITRKEVMKQLAQKVIEIANDIVI